MMSMFWLAISLFAPCFCHMLHDLTAPPPQDQCKSVNASKAPECPMLIGPPCPPCYSNIQPDYQNGDDLSFNDLTKKTMREFIDYYTKWWHVNFPPSKTSEGEYPFSVYHGSAGRAQLFLRLFKYSNPVNKTLLEIAAQYIDHAISLLPANQYYSAYMESHLGVYTLKAFIESAQGNNTEYQQYLQLINKTINNVNEAIKQGLNETVDGINMTMLDLETGLVGLVYNGVFLNFVIKQDIIDPEIIANIAFYVMDKSIETGQLLNTDYLQIEFTYIAGCYLYGTNHGPPGLIYQFIQTSTLYPDAMRPLFHNPKYYNAIKNTLDFYLTVQLSDGNMPTQVGGNCFQDYGNDSDARVQWCHGAPGFINVFMNAAIAFSKYNTSAAEIYFNTALVTANVTWNRGLLVKGTMFCHGVGANINMLWQLGQLIHELQQHGDKAFLEQLKSAGYNLEFLKNQSVWRAKQFLLWTLDWNNLKATRIFDDEGGSSMFGGNFAIGMLYSQILNYTDSGSYPFGESVCHPGWNLCV